jgi:hypothetical protein
MATNSPQMPAPPNAAQDKAVRGTMDALERKGNLWPAKFFQCKYSIGKRRGERAERFITFIAEAQTRTAEFFDGVEVENEMYDQIIRVHEVVVPEAPEDVVAAGEGKLWTRDQFVGMLRLVVGRNTLGDTKLFPAGVEAEPMKEYRQFARTKR